MQIITGKDIPRVYGRRGVFSHRSARFCHAPRARTWFLVCAVAVSGLLYTATSAFALSQRGHEYGFTFASAGSGDGQLSNPGGVAISESGVSKGDVYILDRANNRVEQFGGKGEFLAAWGFGVNREGKASKYEVCQSECKAAVAGERTYQFNASVLAIAVDNCTNVKGEACTSTEDPSVGDVYVAATLKREGEEFEAIDKFSATGQPIEAIHVVKYLQEPGQKRSEAEAEELFAEEAHGLTVGSDGTVWLYYEEDLYGLSDVKLSEATVKQKPLSFSLAGAPASGLAVDAQGDFYLAQEVSAGEGDRDVISEWKSVENESHEAELQEVTEEVDSEATSGLAVDAKSGEVYLDNVASVAAFDQTGMLIQRFGDEASEPSASEHLVGGSGVAVDSQTKDVYVSDSIAGHIDVFRPEDPAAPTVEGISVQDVSSETAQLDASIDPRGATERTTWYFEYGPGPCPGACTKVPGGQLGGQGFGDEGFGEESVEVQLGTGTSAPLAPASTYHYRAIAENEEHGRSIGLERSFSTPPAKGKFIADEREWEMVSPPEKEGASVEPLTLQGAVTQASMDGRALTYIANAPVAHAEGSRSLEPTQMLSTRGAQGFSSQDIVTPNAHGSGIIFGVAPEYQYFSSDLALSLLEPWSTFGGVGGRLAEPPLSPPLLAAEKQEKTIYLRDDRPIAPASSEAKHYEEAEHNGQVQGNPGYLALLSAPDVTSGEPFGALVAFLDATPDLSHVVFRSKVALTREAHGELSGENLYEWSDSSLQLINLLPAASPGVEGALASNATLGAMGKENVRNTISEDGARVFWSSEGHLYVRDTVSRETVQLDKAQGVAEPPGGRAVFQTASADGSRVFFTDAQRLTPTSVASEGSPDLYVFDLSNGRLTDVSEPDPLHFTEHADVQGVPLGASEDGSYVYFVANGVLSSQAQADGATPGRCVELGREEASSPGATCNLYVAHYGGEPGHERWEAPRFIAALSSEDQPDWVGGVYAKGLGEVTSRVSPDGRHLAFMSDRSLTSFQGRPYDNRASAPGANNAPAEEVYEYTAPTGAQPAGLVCASCDPSGARPTGVYDPTAGTEGAEGLGLLVDRPRVWVGRWLAGSVPGWTKLDEKYAALYQSRYLSDSGRLFFDTPEPLVSADKNAMEDVYEYEPAGVPRGRHECTSSSATFSPASGGCVGLISSGTSTHESAFLDASETGGEGESGEVLSEGGSDVFFITAAPLAPQDVDQSFDVYDAHECTSGSPCILAPEAKPPAFCQSTETCRTYTRPPSSPFGASASASSGAAGNLAPQQKVLSSKTSEKPKPKPLTRAQKLAAALKSCRAKHRHSRKLRVSCERQAHKRYASKAKKSAHSARVRKRTPG
jgi:hypothetical protein